MAKLLSGLNMLPEDCVSNILSLTSPVDACRSLLASSCFRSAAESNIVWDKFLPSDYRDVISTSVAPLNFSSKKDLFFQLCHSILIDGGNKRFSLEKSCGRKSYIISARGLSISSSNEPTHWTWKSFSSSRFSEVIELKTISRLEIEGVISAKKLSPNIMYAAYLVVKVLDHAFGLDSISSEVSISVGNHTVSNTARLCHYDNKKQQMECLFYMNRRQILEKRVTAGGDGVRYLSEREDGWMEIELGEFFIGEKELEEVKMSLIEVKGHQLKGGLIIEGIEVRPKC